MKTLDKLIAVIILILVTSDSYSQVTQKKSLTDRKGFIGLSVGPSFATGKFGSSDLQDSLAGFATTGAIFEINFGYRLGKNLGIAVALRGQSNPFDKAAVTNSLLFTGLSIDMEADNWGLGGLLGGLYLSVPTSASLKSSFDARVLIGAVSASSPRIKFTITDLGITAWSEQNSVNASAFGLLIGGGFRFNVSENVSILTNADFFTAKPEFKDIRVVSSDGDVSYFDLSQSMTTFNLSAGIALRLK